MKVSIITTIYKAEKDLPKLLDSMMAQKSENLEFFLIDNGSPDNCKKICEEYACKDNRFVVVSLDHNIGYIRARQFGIENCNGDYVAFCDSDDFLEPEGYDKAIEIILKYNIDVYMTAFKINNGCVCNVENVPYKVGLYCNNEIKNIILPQAFGAFNNSPMLQGFQWKQIIKKQIIAENAIRFIPELKPCEDQIFNIDVLSKCSSVYVDDNVIYNYVVNAESITAKSALLFDIKHEWNQFENLVKEKEKRAKAPDERQAICNQALYTLYWFFLGVSRRTDKGLFEAIKNVNNIIDSSLIDSVIPKSEKPKCFTMILFRALLKRHHYGAIIMLVRTAKLLNR